MSGRKSEGWKEEAGRFIDAHMIEQGDARRSIVAMASRMIDALKGKAQDAHPLTSNPAREFASAPGEVPAMGWQSVMVMGKDQDDWKMDIVGNVGEYYTHIFSNEKPSAVFNTGFYAGVLAVQAGLVDVESFHHDSERKQSPAPEESAPATQA